jgi:hypothetical protein
MRPRRLIAAASTALLIGFSLSVLRAQTPGPSDTAAARPADVDSIGGILRAAYDVISGPAGSRDWQRFHSLFAPGARLIPAGRDSTGHTHLQVTTVDDFAKQATEYFTSHPFYEGEIGRKVDSFGAIAQVFSAYASRNAPNERPFARGINSFQLFNDGTRWYIVTIYWNAERPDLKIPPQYLQER